MTAKGQGRVQRRIAHTMEHGNWVRGCEVQFRSDTTGLIVDLKPGDTVRDFRGETWKFVCATRFRSPELGKTGKIVVRHGKSQMEYYDSVFDLTVEFK